MVGVIFDDENNYYVIIYFMKYLVGRREIVAYKFKCLLMMIDYDNNNKWIFTGIKYTYLAKRLFGPNVLIQS